MAELIFDIGYLIRHYLCMELYNLLQKSQFQLQPRGRQLWLDEEFHFFNVGFKDHGENPDRFEKSSLHNYGLNCVLQGTGIYLDERGRRYELKEGTVFQRRPGVVHTTRFDPGYVEIFLIMDKATYQQLLRLRLIEPFQVLPDAFDEARLRSLLQLQEMSKLSEQEVSSPTILFAMLRFLHPIMEQVRRSGKGESALWGKLDQACSLLRDMPEDRVRLEEIARKVGLSYPTFRRFFRQRVGLSPNVYRIQERISRARELLVEKSVKEVSEELGYPDPFTFSEQFKKQTGINPRDWKRGVAKGMLSSEDSTRRDYSGRR